MKKIYKLMNTALLATLLLTVTGCNDFLDKSVEGFPASSDGKATEVEVFSLYGSLRSYNITAGIPAFAVHYYRSEDSEKGSDSGDGIDVADFFDNFVYNTTNGSVKAYWNSNLDIATRSTQIIIAIDKMIANENNPEALPEEKVTDVDIINKAEAHFFRAYANFNMVRAFGEFPLIDFEVVNPDDVNVAKSKEADIYKLIDEDLVYATSKLPKTWSDEFLGRLTWGAARSLHARTYMMRNDWGNMHTASKEVIDSKLYKLDLPSESVFTDEGELCAESIFELVCTSTASKPSDLGIGSQFAEVQGIRGSGQWNLGWGWHMATKELGEAFEDNDPRKDATLLYFRRSADEKITEENTNKPYGESPISSGMGAYYNKKAYTNPAKRLLYSNGGHWVNIRLIRFADVLLMGAESANELGNTDEALEYLEEVRARARRSATPADLPKVTETDKVKLREKIQNERRIELALEFDRFFDLVRWGLAEKVLHAAGKTNYQHKHRYIPVPQDEIDKSGGVLIQNPDYQ